MHFDEDLLSTFGSATYDWLTRAMISLLEQFGFVPVHEPLA